MKITHETTITLTLSKAEFTVLSRAMRIAAEKYKPRQEWETYISKLNYKFEQHYHLGYDQLVFLEEEI